MIQSNNQQSESNEGIYIGVGSNIEPEKNIMKAFNMLKEKLTMAATSVFYYTPPLKNLDQDDYCNGVWKITTGLTPYVLKYDVLRGIESVLGRIRGKDKYAPRSIDLDILIFGNEVIKTEELVIPDPDVYMRPFVCIPIYEISPDLIVPDTGKTIKEIISGMNTIQMRPAHHLTNQIKKGIKYG